MYLGCIKIKLVLDYIFLLFLTMVGQTMSEVKFIFKYPSWITTLKHCFLSVWLNPISTLFVGADETCFLHMSARIWRICKNKYLVQICYCGKFYLKISLSVEVKAILFKTFFWAEKSPQCLYITEFLHTLKGT